MGKKYFIGEDEYCCTKEMIISDMKKENIHEVEAFEAKMERNSGFFYCKKFHEIGESGSSGCGKECGEYAPRNGKNGRCKYSGQVYEKTHKKVIIKQQ